MNRLTLLACGFVIAFAISACSSADKVTSGAADVRGETTKPGAFLAYEHKVHIKIAAGILPARIAAARTACEDGCFGACTLLRIDETNGDSVAGTIMVRIVPIGVEPLVRLAADGGKVGSRETRADDLSEAVADNAQSREQLTRQRARLAEFQMRKDLSVGDMLTLSRESAAIDVQLDALAKQRPTSNGAWRPIC